MKIKTSDENDPMPPTQIEIDARYAEMKADVESEIKAAADRGEKRILVSGVRIIGYRGHNLDDDLKAQGFRFSWTGHGSWHIEWD